MGFEAERQAIEGRMSTMWAAGPYPTIPVEYENVPIKKPANSVHLALYIRRGDGQQITLGQNPIDRYQGIIQVDIFIPEKDGTKNLSQYADAISSIFKRASFVCGTGVIKCRVPSLGYVGRQGGWLQYAVTVNYHRDDPT